MKALYDNNPQKASDCLNEVYQDEQNFKKLWAQQAKRCVSFANGDQNPQPYGAPAAVNNSPSYDYRREDRLNMYVTNEIQPIIKTITSYMTRSNPAVECTPASYKEQDKNVARLAERLLEAKYDIDNEYSHTQEASFWAVSTGSVFFKDYWDYSLGNYTSQIDEEGVPIIDPETGEPVLDSRKSGNNNVAVLTPMSITLDHSVTDFEQKTYIGESYIMDVEWAREAFDQDLPGYTGKASKIEEDGYIADTLAMLEDMKFSIPYLSSGGGNRTRSKNKCLIREWYIRPSRHFPRGRMLVIAGNQLVYASDPNEGSPYFLQLEPMMWHPYTMFNYEPYVGRLLGKGLVEQLIPIQMRINEINGAILENAGTLAKPNILAAENQLKRGVLNGKGGNIYTYRNIPGAPPPTVLPGMPLPPQFFEELQSLRDRMVVIASTNFVMQGNAPTGVTAASAINQLLENANTQHAGTMKAWEKFHEQHYTKKLRVIHKFMTYPSDYLTQYMRMLSKDSLSTQIDDFVGARDLSDGVNVKIQAGSMIPKSESVKREMYKEMAANGGLGPEIAQPGVKGERLRSQVLEKMGLEPLESDESVDMKKAKWENDRIIRGEPVEVSPYDIHEIHLPLHIGTIQDPKFLENATDEQKLALDAHIQEHQAAAQQKMMMEQMPPPEGAGMPVEGLQPMGEAPPSEPGVEMAA